MLAQLGKQIEKLDPTLKGTVEERGRESNFISTNCAGKRAGTGQKAVDLGHERYLESLLYPTKGRKSGIVPAAVLRDGGWRAQ